MSSIHMTMNENTKQLLHSSSPDLPTRSFNDTPSIDFMHHVGHDEALFIPEADPFNMNTTTATAVTTLMDKSPALSIPSPITSPCDSNNTTPLTSSPKSASMSSPTTLPFGQHYHSHSRNNNSSISCHHHPNVLLDDEAYFQLSEYLSHSSDSLQGDLATNHRRLLLDSHEVIKEELSPSSSSSLNMDGLQIRVIGAPDKSRVETQTRLCIQLLTSNGTKVTSWPSLKLPEHLLARSRLKKSLQQQRAAAAAAATSSTLISDTTQQQHMVLSDESSSLSKAIYLDAKVVCASQPDQPVKVCSGCIQRERKRAERSKNGANQHKNNNSNTVGPRSIIDDIPEQDRILLFNCGPMVNFSSGDAILPTRITCYCRHHNEKVGFCVQFTMKTDKGDIIAMGMSPPILITDDHKSTRQKGRKRDRTDFEPKSSSTTTSTSNSHQNNNHPKIRKLPSRTSSTTPVTPAASRRGSISINNMENIPTLETTDPNDLSILDTQNSTPITASAMAASSFHTSLPTPSEEQNNPCGNPLASFFPLPPLSSSNSSPTLNPTLEHRPAVVIPSTSTSSSSSSTVDLHHQHHYISPEHLTSSSSSPSPSTTPTHLNRNTSTTPRTPQLERLVPAQGPTYGGCEVTILGSNFYRGLTCLFGEHQATTVFWNPNTLVCVLPPASHPGPVVVSFKQHSLVLEGQDVPLFTYYDANDQALLELALQVVGLKMTGKLQDAKHIAMRIVQGGDNNPFLSQQQQSNNNNYHRATLDASNSGYFNIPSSTTTPNGDGSNTWISSPVSPLTLDDNQDEGPLSFEERVIQIIDQHQGLTHELLHVRTPVTGHTLLHLAAWTGYTKLAMKLINMCPEMLDACDRNGLTPLSLARIKGHHTSIVLDVMVQTGNHPTNKQSAMTIPQHHSVNTISSTTAQLPMSSIMLQDPFRYHYPLMTTQFSSPTTSGCFPSSAEDIPTTTYHIKPTLTTTTTRNINNKPSSVSDMLPYSSICSSITPLLFAIPSPPSSSNSLKYHLPSPDAVIQQQTLFFIIPPKQKSSSSPRNKIMY
ncbi:hypothetical protein BDA99DRAFT_274103 [Phascolomyces articulosus]|uniref:IPT/TIG domain-containing protein n=1 Tax=Phascolomyces articulosus TaxID=60185 RepID=A0AAD5PHD6_9FUNG|nr:hypothetical protein BDA99DRAFT_274103 [Phascolomyces articulosus]